MSIFNDIENRISNAEKVKNFSKRFLPRHWTFLVLGLEKKWYGSSFDGQWDRTANKMVQQFKETGCPIFTATSALGRAILRQRRGKSTIHFNGYFMNTELLSPAIDSLNQVSIYAAVTNWCYKFALKEEEKHIPTPVDHRILAIVEPEEVEMLTSSPNLAQGNLMMRSEAKFKVLEKNVHMTQLCEKSLIPISCHSRKSLQSSTRWRRRMRTNHTLMQRMCLFSSLSTSQKVGSFSSRHSYRTDLRFILWTFLTNMDWKLRFHQFANLETWLTLWHPEKPSALWMKFILTKQKPDRAENGSKIFKNPKKARLTNKER